MTPSHSGFDGWNGETRVGDHKDQEQADPAAVEWPPRPKTEQRVDDNDNDRDPQPSTQHHVAAISPQVELGGIEDAEVIRPVSFWLPIVLV